MSASEQNQHKPFKIYFNFGAAPIVVTINNITGELFCFFPKIPESSYLLERSCDDIKIYNNTRPNHVSLHRDGTIHLKYDNDSKKTVINHLEEPFRKIDKQTLVPCFSFSLGVEGKGFSVICLVAGKDIIKNLNLLPNPYAYFLIKGKKNAHVNSLINSGNGLEFGHMFMFLPFFIPRNGLGVFSMAIPLQEDDLLNIYKNMTAGDLQKLEKWSMRCVDVKMKREIGGVNAEL